MLFYFNNGWPTTHSQVMTEAKLFFNIRNELTVVNGIIFKGSRVVIPKSMQQSILRSDTASQIMPFSRE